MTDGFSLLDGAIVAAYLVGVIVLGVLVRRSVRRVEDFLVAGREVKLFLGVTSLAASEFGVVTCMYTAEMGYRYGFAGMTPGFLSCLALLTVGLTGFCIRPLRESGVTTIPELFEAKFGVRIRVLAGIVIVVSGLLNMGLFLRMGGEFLVIVAGLPSEYLEITMTCLLVVVAVYTMLGGMLAVLVTDFVQFLVMSLGLTCVSLLILSQIGFDRIVASVEQVRGAEALNPFGHEVLGPGYLAYNGLVLFASVLTHQPMISRVVAAKNPRTAQRIYVGTAPFFICRFVLPGLWGMAALAALTSLPPDGESIRAMPLFVASFVPVGLLGLVVAAMIAADMSTISTYMVTWGTVIYNDIVAPFRGEGPEAGGLRWNRLIVLCIGLFLLLYGLWYPLQGPLWNYLILTATISLASMSVMFIACCYWRRASTTGAALSMIGGATCPIAFLVLQHGPTPDSWREAVTMEAAGLGAFLLATLGMIAGSLLFPSRGRTMP